MEKSSEKEAKTPGEAYEKGMTDLMKDEPQLSEKGVSRENVEVEEGSRTQFTGKKEEGFPEPSLEVPKSEEEFKKVVPEHELPEKSEGYAKIEELPLKKHEETWHE